MLSKFRLKFTQASANKFAPILPENIRMNCTSENWRRSLTYSASYYILTVMITTLILGMVSRSTWILKPLGPESRVGSHADHFEKILLISSVFNVEFEDIFPMKWLRLVINQKFPNSKDTRTRATLTFLWLPKYTLRRRCWQFPVYPELTSIV